MPNSSDRTRGDISGVPMTKRHQPPSSGGVQGVRDLGAPGVGRGRGARPAPPSWWPARRSARSARTTPRAGVAAFRPRSCRPGSRPASRTADRRSCGTPWSSCLRRSPTGRRQCSTGRANTHARAVVPSSPVHAQPISCTTSLPTPAISTSSPFPYDESEAGLPPTASSTASSGTSWQNSIRGSSISTVFRLAIGVGAGSGAAFSSSLQPVTTARARSAAGTARIGRRADECSMRYTVGVLTYARPA